MRLVLTTCFLVFLTWSAFAQPFVTVTNTIGYPVGSTPITAVGTGTTGAVTATLAAAANTITYICGFDVSAIGGTATLGPITIATLTGGTTFTYQLASAAAGTTLGRTFTPCIPGNAVNSTIAVATTADGTASAVDVNAWGYQK